MTANRDTYGLGDFRIGEPPEPTDEYRVRRRIGDALKRIADRMVRCDAPSAELEAIAAELEAVATKTSVYGRRSQSDIYARLFARNATRQDVLDILDYEIFTGLSTPISPPMQLWLDGDVVRGKANLGLPFQGPPGRVHGGVIAAMLDVLMAKTQDLTRTMGVTGTLNIRYIRATPLKTDIDMEARVLRTDGRKLFCEGRFFVDGQQTVHADGIWIAMREVERGA
ncbi:MAG: PaaI family thioesterase [Pseudomonadota bacterium]